ncbi:MAG: FtsX-like permease family protein, partial [Sphaerochaeta sp.]
IAVSVMSIILLLALLDSMEDDMRHTLTTYYTGDVRVRHDQYTYYERYTPLHLNLDTEKTQTLIRTVETVVASTPRITFGASLHVGDRSRPVQAVGVDFTQEQQFIDFAHILSEGAVPAPGTHEVILGIGLAQTLGLTVGDRLTLLAKTALQGSNAISFTVSGLIAPPVGMVVANGLYLNLSSAQRLLMMDTKATDIVIKAQHSTDLRQLAQIIEDTLHQGDIEAQASAFMDINELYGFLATAKLIYWVIALIFFILGSTVIINTTMMVVYERMAEIGMMKAMGMSDRRTSSLFMLEGFFISAVGAGIGLIIGVIVTLILSKVGLDFTEALSGIEMEISSILRPQVDLLTALLVALFGMVIATLSTLIPSRRAAKIQIVEALHYV